MDSMLTQTVSSFVSAVVAANVLSNHQHKDFNDHTTVYANCTLTGSHRLGKIKFPDFSR